MRGNREPIQIWGQKNDIMRALVWEDSSESSVQVGWRNWSQTELIGRHHIRLHKSDDWIPGGEIREIYVKKSW